MSVLNPTITTNVAAHRTFDIQYAVVPLSVSGGTIALSNSASGGSVYISAAATVEFDGTEFSASSADWSITGFNCSNSGADVTTTNMIFSGTVNWPYQYLWDAGASGMTWASDYNTFGPNFQVSIFGTLYSDLATYQSATSQDAHSTGP